MYFYLKVSENICKKYKYSSDLLGLIRSENHLAVCYLKNFEWLKAEEAVEFLHSQVGRPSCRRNRCYHKHYSNNWSMEEEPLWVFMPENFSDKVLMTKFKAFGAIDKAKTVISIQNKSVMKYV